MKATIELDRQGKLQLPPRIRKAAGFANGTSLRCTVEAGVVRLEAATDSGRIRRRKNGGKVFVGQVPAVDVSGALQKIRAQRTTALA